MLKLGHACCFPDTGKSIGNRVRECRDFGKAVFVCAP